MYKKRSLSCLPREKSKRRTPVAGEGVLRLCFYRRSYQPIGNRCIREICNSSISMCKMSCKNRNINEETEEKIALGFFAIYNRWLINVITSSASINKLGRKKGLRDLGAQHCFDLLTTVTYISRGCL